MKAVILAGGEGTRLRPLTLTTPKPVVPVVDRPFLRHQLDLLATVGVTEVVFSVAYRPERIQSVFGDGGALAPVPNPVAYGLVECAAAGRVCRFIEKPDPSQVTTDTINAGIYVLEKET